MLWTDYCVSIELIFCREQRYYHQVK